MSEDTARPFRIYAVGRHTRVPDLASVRRTCLTTLIALVVQFALGMWLNLYVQIPSADQHAGFAQEIRNGPMILTVHALVGTFLIGAAIVLLIRAIRVRSRQVVALAAAGLGAILCAFASGEFFVRDGGESRASLSMAVLTGIALLCYIFLQTLTSARMLRAHPQQDDPREPVQRLPGRPRVAPMGPGVMPMPAPGPPGWPDVAPAAAAGQRQPGYWPAMPNPAPVYWNSASGPYPGYPQTGRSEASSQSAYP